MRTRVAATILAGFTSLMGAAKAMDNDVLAQGQAPGPTLPPPAPPDLFRLPPDLFTPPQPRTEPVRPARPLQRQGAPSVCAHIRVIPADPTVDPKFILPAPPTGRAVGGRNLPPPMPACQYGERTAPAPRQ
jgi:hypothetical protein